MIPEHNILHFGYNWNQKLRCQAFTTIRLDQPKYSLGSLWAIHLKGKPIRSHLFEIRERKTFLLDDITDYMAYIDTGYNAARCREIICQMYKNRAINWNTQRLCMPLLVITTHDLQSEQLNLL